MPFIMGGKLFFALDGVDYVASGNIFMKNNLLLTAAYCDADFVIVALLQIAIRSKFFDCSAVDAVIEHERTLLRTEC